MGAGKSEKPSTPSSCQLAAGGCATTLPWGDRATSTLSSNESCSSCSATEGPLSCPMAWTASTGRSTRSWERPS